MLDAKHKEMATKIISTVKFCKSQLSNIAVKQLAESYDPAVQSLARKAEDLLEEMDEVLRLANQNTEVDLAVAALAMKWVTIKAQKLQSQLDACSDRAVQKRKQILV